MNFGVDFAGGTEMRIGFAKDAQASQLRTIAEENSIDSLVVQSLDGGKREYLLRYEEGSEQIANDKNRCHLQFPRWHVGFRSVVSATRCGRGHNV